MNHHFEVILNIDSHAAIFKDLTWHPDEAFFRDWIWRSFIGSDAQNSQRPIEINIYLTTANEIQQLNSTYRSKDKATNVLSFPAGALPGYPYLALGDMIFCPEVIYQEAQEQKKHYQNHFAHLIIHATLHLLGYDHIEAEEAAEMEAIEIAILAKANIANPYVAPANL